MLLGNPKMLGAAIFIVLAFSVSVVAVALDVAFSFMVTVMISPTLAALSSPNKKLPRVFPGQSAPSLGFCKLGLGYNSLGMIVDLLSTALCEVEQAAKKNTKNRNTIPTFLLLKYRISIKISPSLYWNPQAFHKLSFSTQCLEPGP